MILKSTCFLNFNNHSINLFKNKNYLRIWNNNNLQTLTFMNLLPNAKARKKFITFLLKTVKLTYPEWTLQTSTSLSRL